MDTERLRQFQELIALEPDDTVLRFGLGELYIEAKDFASAAEQFAEILRLDPHYSAAYRYLGQAYAALGRVSEAEAVFQQGIRWRKPVATCKLLRKCRSFSAVSINKPPQAHRR